MALRFLVVAYGFSWSVAAILFATGGLGGVRHQLGGFLFMLGPAVAALVTTPRAQWGPAFALRPRFNRWLAFAFAVPVLVIAGATFASVLFPQAKLVAPVDALKAMLPAAQAVKLDAIPSTLLSVGLVAQAFLFGPLLNTPLMLSEELGWRGALWSTCQPRLGFWKNALATGVVWGFWHAPLILMGHNYPDAPVLGVFVMVVFCVAMTPVLHHLRERGGSLWHACLFHGTVNAGSTLGVLCLQTDHWFARGIVGVPGIVALALSALVVWRVRR